MKIWEKNYVLTMALLLSLLFGSLFFLQQYSFRQNLDKYCDNASINETQIEYAVSSYLYNGKEPGRLAMYCRRLQKQGIYLQVRSQGDVLAGSLPFPWEGRSEKDFQLVKRQGMPYLCIANTYPDFTYGAISILYLEEISSLYQSQRRQMHLLLGAAVFLSLLLSVILYYTMQRIYAPVRNIAHELRTPLTAIQGYAQYISLGNIGMEDILFAGSQIDLQAQHLNALIENLLIMGNLRDGKITMAHMEPGELIKGLRPYFPSLSIGGLEGRLYGDKNLLLSLLRNLISNTCRQGEDILLTIRGNAITIYNKDGHIPSDMLRLLNENRPIPQEMVAGRGLGVPLCHEILKMHHGVIRYQNLPEGGVNILASLWSYPRLRA